MKDDLYYMNIAYKEALKAYKKNEIPIGVIIVKDNIIISKAHNLRDSKKIVTKHAEIIAIEKSNKKLNNWRLNNCVLYSTLEPCKMCSEVIKEAKIKKVIYGTNNKCIHQNNNFIQIDDNQIIKKCEFLIKNKFIELRNK